ncbi:MAG: hypothetical protein MUW51_06075 [Lactococcus lactis]|nr:hypothetical protein [Lactococcus lactis]
MKKRNQPLIKIVITLLTLIVLILIGIPFSKYFLIATHTQETKTIIHNKMPGIIPKTEKIEAPNLATLMGQAPQADNQKTIWRECLCNWSGSYSYRVN